MTTNEDEKKRVITVAIFVVILFSILIVQFFQLQIRDGNFWEKRAKRQHYFSIEEPFARGTFFSNSSIKKGHPDKSHPFAIDVLKFHVHIDPLSIPVDFRNEVSRNLSKLLDFEANESKKLEEQFRKKSRSRRVAMWQSPEKKDEIGEWWQPFAKENGIPRNALFFVKDYKRSYPFGKMLGQVLHTVQNQKDDETKQAIPTGGLELKFNSILQGKLGKRLLMRSPRHSFEMGEVITPPENGADIYLTINHYLQAVVEEELAKGVHQAKAKGGWAVMMDPHTGEILALAQYPFFHPEEYRKYFNDPEKIKFTKVRAVVEAYEPGSVMKPFTALIGFLANEEMKKRGLAPVFDPDEKIPSLVGTFPGRNAPIHDVNSHAYLNLAMAMQKSSNIYMARLVERVIDSLGEKWYRNVLSEYFGIAKLTEIELPGESKGVLPTPGKLHPNGKLEWSVPTPFSIAIGHNIQLNSIQLIRAWAILANGGYLVKPTLIKKIVKNGSLGEGEPFLNPTSKKKVFDSILVDHVVQVMRYGTLPGGTGARGNIHGFTEVGKSGTSRKISDGKYSSKKHIASFIGFAPAEDPAFILLVTLDEPEVKYIPGVGHNNHGGVCAAPIFKRVGTKTLQYLGVEPDDPFGYPLGDPRFHPKKAVWWEKTRLLREMYDSWNK